MTVQSYHPLSENQYGLWLLQTLNPTMCAYNIASVFRITTPLDGAALQRALQRVVHCHPLLRTTFVLQDNHPVQCVHAELAPLFEQVDGADLTEEVLQRAVQAAHDRPFDLSTGPLVRLTIFRCASADQVLLFNSHHILLDFKSQAQITQELLAAYQDEMQGEIAPTWHPEPVQKEERASYNEFVDWQQAFLTSQQSERHQRYWREQLQAPLPVLTLPTSRPYPPQQSYQGASLPVCLSNDLTQGVLRLAEQKTVTPFIVLLAAYTLLLARYGRQAELIVGIASSERLRAPQRFQQTLGHLVNLLPMRFTLTPDATFADLLQQTQKVVMGGLFYQNYPFAHMVRDAQIERDPSRPPLFEVSFNMPTLDTAQPFVSMIAGAVKVDRGPVMVHGLPITPYPIRHQEAQVPLHLDMWLEGEQLVGYFKYNSDLFDEATIARMAGHFAMLLQGIVAQPDRLLWQLPLLTKTEYQQIVHDWNDTAVDFGPPQTIHALFEQQVARTPDAVALSYESRVMNYDHAPSTEESFVTRNAKFVTRLTYAQLNARANQLAHHLLELGVKPDTLVAVVMERSIEMVVSLLAVLKSGGVYVPIDPSYPAERIRFMLTDSAAPILLTQSHLPLAQEIDQLIQHFIRVDRLGVQLAGRPTDNPQTATTPANLAYVIYTSGSTGQPKGVVIEHGGLVAHCWQIRQHYELTAADGVLQFASLSFDAALEQLLPPLICGARVLLGQAWLPVDLTQQLVAQGISVVDLPPAYWQQLFQLWVESPTLLAQHRLRLLIAGADVLRHEIVALWQQSPLRQVRLINAYGPTEATIAAACFDLPPTLPEPHTPIPIGRPVGNKRLYILDAAHNPTPIGIPGELCIGGAGIAREYLHQPVLTAAKFITNPFHGGRLYKTGDLARYRSDGNIEFLGRLDSQVKIRGFRIELGEIEAILNQHEAVQEAIVVVREDVPGEKRLVAYLVRSQGSEVKSQRASPQATPEDESRLLAAYLRSHLQSKVPEYMIPTAFVELERLPLTPNGKIDHKALPVLEYNSAKQSYIPAETFDEMRLVLLWQEVLGVHPISVEDNFFELGGQSLLATRLVQKMRQTLQRDLSLQQLFKTPTIRGLLSGLAEGPKTHSSFVPLRTADKQTSEKRFPLFLLPPVGGLALPYATLLPYLSLTQPIYAYQARGIHDDLPPFDSLIDLATATIQEMKSIQPHGPYAIGGWSFGGMVAFEIARQLTQQGETVSFLGVMDSYPRLPKQAIPHEALTPQAELQDFLYLLGDVMGSDYRNLEETLFVKALEAEQPIEWLLNSMRQQGHQLVLDATIIKRIWLTLQHNSQLLQAYQPQPYTGGITLFCAKESAPPDGIQCWQALTLHPVDAVWVSGEHQTMLQAGQVETLACTLEKRLQAVNVRRGKAITASGK